MELNTTNTLNNLGTSTNFNANHNYPYLTAVYSNSVGVLKLKLFNINLSENVKVFRKNDDGKITMKIVDGSDFYEFSVFFSNSMRVKFMDPNITDNVEDKVVIFKFLVTPELIRKDSIINEIQKYLISDCFESNNTPVLLHENWSNLKSIICANCETVLVSNLNSKVEEQSMSESTKDGTYKSKLVYNFNYDYIDNLELLSCHETDINNIIPNMDEKLKIL